MRKFLISLTAPALAFVFAIVVTWILLMATGHDPIATFKAMGSYGIKPDSLTLTVNLAVTYYLSAIAVAIGFRQGGRDASFLGGLLGEANDRLGSSGRCSAINGVPPRNAVELVAHRAARSPDQHQRDRQDDYHRGEKHGRH